MKRRAHRRGLWLALGALAVIVWAAFVLQGSARPSITLPGGTVVTYHGSSRGVLQPFDPPVPPSLQPRYLHAAPPQEFRARLWWKARHAALPEWLRSHLPVSDMITDYFPDQLAWDECELRFRVIGNLEQRLWHIFVVDDNGWETRVRDYVWGDDGRFDHGASERSGWIRLGATFPRHSKTLRVRFRDPSSVGPPGAGPPERLERYTEMTLRNPFYEGEGLATAIAQGDPLPISKPLHGGTATLTKVTRDTVVGEGYGALVAELRLDRAGLPLDGYGIAEMRVSDSLGQCYRQMTTGLCDGGRHLMTSTFAPWSEDPSWSLTFLMCHEDYVPRGTTEGALSLRRLLAPETMPGGDEIFRFEKLPVPTDKPIELNRTLTQRGICLRLGTLTAAQDGARFTVEGWNHDDQNKKVLVIYDASDDQGRWRATTKEGYDVQIVGNFGLAGAFPETTFSVQLPKDAKWWNVSLLPETLTEVEFTVRPPSVK